MGMVTARRAITVMHTYGPPGALGGSAYGPVPMSDKCPRNPGGMPACPLDDAAAATMQAGRGAKPLPAAESKVWATIGFVPFQSLADDRYFLLPCSPKPDWDDELVSALLGTPGVSEENRGGVGAKNAARERRRTDGRYEGEPRFDGPQNRGRAAFLYGDQAQPKGKGGGRGSWRGGQGGRGGKGGVKQEPFYRR